MGSDESHFSSQRRNKQYVPRQWIRGKTNEDSKTPISAMKRTGVGIAQRLERRSPDRKVAGSNPCRSGGIKKFSRVNFLCWLLFRYPFHPRVTAVARKRPRSFCQKCRWQVTAKHALHLTYVALHEVAWCMVVWCTQNLRRYGSSFMWHQPCQHCKYTTSEDIQKRAIKSYSLM